jgi:hypothetical protein
LRGFVESWLGKSFKNNEEAERFDIEMLLGKAALLEVIQTHKDDHTYANIDDISPLPKDMPTPALEADPILYAGNHTTGYRQLPEWIQKKISSQLRESPPAPSDPAEISDQDIPF